MKEITQIRRFIGLSTDDLPTDVPPGSKHFATDKGVWSIFDGAAWWPTDALVHILVRGFALAEHDDAAPVQLLDANGEGDGARAVLIVAKCTEALAGSTKLPAFAISDGADVTFGTIGDGGNPATFAKDAVAIFAGTLDEEKPVIITATDGSGDGVAGAIQAYVIAVELGGD